MREGPPLPYWATAVDDLEWHRWDGDPPRPLCGIDATPSRHMRRRILGDRAALRVCLACDAAMRYPPEIPGEPIVWSANDPRNRRGQRPRVWHPSRDCAHFRGRSHEPFPIPLRVAESLGHVPCSLAPTNHTQQGDRTP